MNKGENMKNNRGFTLTEFIVSFSLLMIVIVYLLRTIIVISNKNQELLILQEYEVIESTLLNKINDDIKNFEGNVEIREENNSIYISGIDEYIKFNNDENYITYNDTIYELPQGVEIGNTPYTISNIKDGSFMSSNTSFNVASINLLINGNEKKIVISNQYYDDTVEKATCYYEAGKTWNFDYTGSEQSFNAICQGVYKIELWGAEGGSLSDEYPGGYGGYSIGYINLKKNTKLYINVGGAGTTSKVLNPVVTGGYNGGGNGYVIVSNCENFGGSGGGATHIAFSSGLLQEFEKNLESLIMVAGGGGGASYRNCSSSDYHYSSGGSGGGYIGSNKLIIKNSGWEYNLPGGGTQTSGGNLGNMNNESGAAAGEFGLGGTSTRTGGYTETTGGGSGLYGGGSGMFIGGAGGSGYISNFNLTSKKMVCYNCTESSDTQTKTISTSNVSSIATADYAKQGNGYARITYIGP